LKCQFLSKLGIIGRFRIIFRFHTNESMDCLSSNVVCAAYYCRFGDSLVEDESGFDVCGGKSVAGYVDYVWGLAVIEATPKAERMRRTEHIDAEVERMKEWVGDESDGGKVKRDNMGVREGG
jgi:hypothetical protein